MFYCLIISKINSFCGIILIYAVFKEIGVADELGSGIKNTVKYTNIYSGGIPSFKDDDIFKVTVPINQINNKFNINKKRLKTTII